MKIGIICYPTFGGSGVVATELGLELAKKGHEIHFISYQQPARLTGLLPNVFFHQVQMSAGEYPLFLHQPYEWALTSKIVWVTENYQLDFLHVHYAIPHASAAYMAREILREKNIFLPFLTTLHGTDITLLGGLPMYKPMIEFTIRHSNAISSVSESLKRDTYKNFSIEKNIEVIPNFINLETYQNPKKCARHQIGAVENEIIFVHISNFRPVKRVADVIEIFDRVQKEIPARLVLAGDGPERSAIENLVTEKNLLQKVRFLGNIDCVPSLLSLADIFILPSAQESFGLSALEAMAAACPVISSNAGGLKEVNIDGETGFLSPVGDIENMSKNALFLAKNPEILKEFKHKARQRAEKFQVQFILPKYENLYQHLMALKV